MHRPMFSGFGAITVQIAGRKTECFHEPLTEKIERVGADTMEPYIIVDLAVAQSQ